jgi:hypothetical protein
MIKFQPRFQGEYEFSHKKNQNNRNYAHLHEMFEEVTGHSQIALGSCGLWGGPKTYYRIPNDLDGVMHAKLDLAGIKFKMKPLTPVEDEREKQWIQDINAMYEIEGNTGSREIGRNLDKEG